MSAENIINNPSSAFTEPCEACGVSEFQLGVTYAEERIIKLLEGIAITTKHDEVAVMELLSAIVALIKGEQK